MPPPPICPQAPLNLCADPQQPCMAWRPQAGSTQSRPPMNCRTEPSPNRHDCSLETSSSGGPHTCACGGGGTEGAEALNPGECANLPPPQCCLLLCLLGRYGEALSRPPSSPVPHHHESRHHEGRNDQGKTTNACGPSPLSACQRDDQARGWGGPLMTKGGRNRIDF